MQIRFLQIFPYAYYFCRSCDWKSVSIMYVLNNFYMHLFKNVFLFLQLECDVCLLLIDFSVSLFGNTMTYEFWIEIASSKNYIGTRSMPLLNVYRFCYIVPILILKLAGILLVLVTKNK